MEEVVSKRNSHNYKEWKKFLHYCQPADFDARKMTLHCKCFVCWNRRQMSANQVHRQLAVVLTDENL